MRLQLKLRLLYYSQILLLSLIAVSAWAYCVFINTNFGPRLPSWSSLSLLSHQVNNEVEILGENVIETTVIQENGRMACNIPKLNPFDASIKIHLGDPDPFICTTDHPLIFQTDLDSKLIQVKNPQDYGYFNCCYKELKRLDADWNVM